MRSCCENILWWLKIHFYDLTCSKNKRSERIIAYARSKIKKLLIDCTQCAVSQHVTTCSWLKTYRIHHSVRRSPPSPGIRHRSWGHVMTVIIIIILYYLPRCRHDTCRYVISVQYACDAILPRLTVITIIVVIIIIVIVIIIVRYYASTWNRSGIDDDELLFVCIWIGSQLVFCTAFRRLVHTA